MASDAAEENGVEQVCRSFLSVDGKSPTIRCVQEPEYTATYLEDGGLHLTVTLPGKRHADQTAGHGELDAALHSNLINSHS